MAQFLLLALAATAAQQPVKKKENTKQDIHDKVPAGYRRYLENIFRKVFKLEGTPIQIEFKTGKNPFEGRRTQIDPRIADRKRRFVQKFKKMNNKRK